MRLLKTAAIAFLALIMVLLFSLFTASTLLLYEKRIDAGHLMVEGWVPRPTLLAALEEFKRENYQYIITSGSPITGPFSLNSNTFLVFKPQFEGTNSGADSIITFSINAESSLGPKDSAHFVFWVNDQPIKGFYTIDAIGGFIFDWEIGPQDIDSIMIEFDNHAHIKRKERNLIINRLSINGTALNANNSLIFEDLGTPFGKDRINLSAGNYADLAGIFFIDAGIPVNKVIAVANHDKKYRRTLGNALAVKDWIYGSGNSGIKINIITTRYHSRRTWLTYKKVLDGVAEVGVIPQCDFEARQIGSKNLTRFKESLALLYYAVFIFPFV